MDQHHPIEILSSDEERDETEDRFGLFLRGSFDGREPTNAISIPDSPPRKKARRTEPQRVWELPSSKASHCRFNSDGSILSVCFYDRLALYRVPEKEPWRVYRSKDSSHGFLCSSFGTILEDRKLIACAFGSLIRVIQFYSSRVHMNLQGHGQNISAITFHPCKKGILFTSSSDKSCRMWSLQHKGVDTRGRANRQGVCIAIFATYRPTFDIISMDVDVDGDQLILCDQSTIVIFALDSKEIRQTSRLEEYENLRGNFQPLLVVRSRVYTKSAHGETKNMIAVRCIGRHVISQSNDMLRCWSIDKRRTIFRVDEVMSCPIVISRDKNMMSYGNMSGELHFLTMEGQKKSRCKHDGALYKYQYIPFFSLGAFGWLEHQADLLFTSIELDKVHAKLKFGHKQPAKSSRLYKTMLSARIIGQRFRPSSVQSRSFRRQQSSLVETQVSDGIAIIRLNQPETLNALTEKMGDTFLGCIADLNRRSDVRCAVLTGAGKAFSAGGDLQFLLDRAADTPQNNAELMRKFYSRFLSVRSLKVPVLSAINGHAVGAGLCLALATDIRLAARSAKMGVTFTNLGIHPGMAATHFLPSLIGNQNAAHLLLSGDLVSAEEAQRLGVVLSVHDDGDLMDRAMAMAASLSSKSSVAIQTTVRTLRNKQEVDIETALWREASAQAICYSAPDIVEGVNAVKEKRKPTVHIWEAFLRLVLYGSRELFFFVSSCHAATSQFTDPNNSIKMNTAAQRLLPHFITNPSSHILQYSAAAIVGASATYYWSSSIKVEMVVNDEKVWSGVVGRLLTMRQRQYKKDMRSWLLHRQTSSKRDLILQLLFNGHLIHQMEEASESDANGTNPSFLREEKKLGKMHDSLDTDVAVADVTRSIGDDDATSSVQELTNGSEISKPMIDNIEMAILELQKQFQIERHLRREAEDEILQLKSQVEELQTYIRDYHARRSTQRTPQKEKKNSKTSQRDMTPIHASSHIKPSQEAEDKEDTKEEQEKHDEKKPDKRKRHEDKKKEEKAEKKKQKKEDTSPSDDPTGDAKSKPEKVTISKSYERLNGGDGNIYLRWRNHNAPFPTVDTFVTLCSTFHRGNTKDISEDDRQAIVKKHRVTEAQVKNWVNNHKRLCKCIVKKKPPTKKS
ncbi:hypothetical protein PROFUN_08985 [Planoprotostelium fungivorum]|uniref:Uncharacterized protein n=1 Tax=Planoprotostelium fungivorum TaxID=1890364 RepID=A0A2P6NIL9_9EUKA|nr:hypothetical protein PROFUN_08985 [Planoprotostelium fungivorum]